MLKTLGFRGSTIFSLILAESLLMLIIGGGIGLLIAYNIVELAKVQVTPLFYLSAENILIGLVIIVVTGIVVGGIPALQAKRLSIIEALGRS